MNDVTDNTFSNVRCSQTVTFTSAPPARPGAPHPPAGGGGGLPAYPSMQSDFRDYSTSFSSVGYSMKKHLQCRRTWKCAALLLACLAAFLIALIAYLIGESSRDYAYRALLTILLCFFIPIHMLYVELSNRR